ncbi:Uncharacterised protein [Mycobacteroides abscessus]|nr:Uncharacterised protein [Mycobacteroides abscessus]
MVCRVSGPVSLGGSSTTSRAREAPGQPRQGSRSEALSSNRVRVARITPEPGRLAPRPGAGLTTVVPTTAGSSDPPRAAGPSPSVRGAVPT